MPFSIIVSAVPLIRSSSMFAAKVFQEFQPMGGVSASPSNFWANAVEVKHRAASRRAFFMKKEVAIRVFQQCGRTMF